MNNIDDVYKRYTDIEEKIQLKKWLQDYIVPLDKDKITWLQLDHVGMQKFLEENYIDENGNRIGWYNSILYNVLGMKYLAYCNIAMGFNYLIGVIPNNIGRQTIVACLCYQKNRRWSLKQEEPVNFIQMIETNRFYRKQGIFNILVEKIMACLNLSQDLVTTDEYDDGLSCHTVTRLRNTLEEQGFEKEVLTYTEYKERTKQKKFK